MSRRRVIVVAGALTLAVLVLAVDPALAAEERGSGIADKFDQEITSWGQALLLSLAALVGLPALFKRDVGQAMVIALIVLVLGGFVFAPDAVRDNVIQPIWKFVAPGA